MGLQYRDLSTQADRRVLGASTVPIRGSPTAPRCACLVAIGPDTDCPLFFRMTTKIYTMESKHYMSSTTSPTPPSNRRRRIPGEHPRTRPRRHRDEPHPRPLRRRHDDSETRRQCRRVGPSPTTDQTARLSPGPTKVPTIVTEPERDRESRANRAAPPTCPQPPPPPLSPREDRTAPTRSRNQATPLPS